MAVNETRLRRTVLEHLRDINRQQAAQNEILTLDLDAVATASDTSVEDVRQVLSDLITEGLVEGFAVPYSQTATDGACRITAAGLAELRG